MHSQSATHSARPVERSGGVTGLTNGASPARILLVEDDDAVAKVLADLLRLSGYLARRARTAGEAMCLAEDQEYDLILSDLRLPGRDGLRLLHDLVMRRPAWRSRFVLITADALGTAADFTARTGVACLPKPFRLPQLAHVIEDVLLRADGHIAMPRQPS